MTRLERYFEDYGSYHSDWRNKATHAIGIPIIVLALLMWAARLSIALADGIRIDLAMVLVAFAGVLYVSLSLPLGLAMTLALTLLYGVGRVLLGNDVWIALWLFVGGWVLQFVGHVFEGRRPAFLRNATHLLIGPIYILDTAIGRREREPSTKPSR
jgi:uncharacterized membrane protein YGL010W